MEWTEPPKYLCVKNDIGLVYRALEVWTRPYDVEVGLMDITGEPKVDTVKITDNCRVEVLTAPFEFTLVGRKDSRLVKTSLVITRILCDGRQIGDVEYCVVVDPVNVVED